MDRGGDPTTDHASLVFVGNTETRAATCPPYRPGRLASATALTLSVSPAQYTVSVDISVSRTPDAEDSDELSKFHESRDGLQSRAVSQGHEHSHGSLLDRLLEKRFSNSTDIAFSRVFRDDEMFEQLRQSDLKVQNLPTSVSSSELSAHQLGGTLAGRFGHEKVDGHPPDYFTPQDRALLRRYSKVFCDEVVQNKSDGLRSRGDEHTRTIKDVSADASCLEVSTETVVSPVPIAVTVSPTKDDLADGKRLRSQDGKRKSRRYTGKAVKNNLREQVPIIKDVPTDEKLQVQSSGSTLGGVAGVPIISMDLEVSAVKRSSSSTLDGCNRVAEVLVPHSYPGDLRFIQKLGATDCVMLHYTLVADKVLPHGFLGDFLNFGTTRSTIVGQELESCNIYFRLSRRDAPGDAKKKIAGQCTSDSISHRSASGCG